jgi:hypothetical protein
MSRGHQRPEGRLRCRIAPLIFLFPPCFRFPASPAPARPRHPWRSRAFGGGVQEAADRENLAKKEVTSVAAKKKSSGGKKKSSKKSSKKK